MKSLLLILIFIISILNTSCSKSAKARNFKLVIGASAGAVGTPINGGAILKLVNPTTSESLTIEMNTEPYIATIANGTWDMYLIGFTGPSPWQGTTYCGSQAGKIFTGVDIDVTINATAANCANDPYATIISTKTPSASLWDSAQWDQATWSP